ncbi:MAG: hypothetical protein WC568_12015, partial [Candidatus Methanoperedens sp.]
IKQEVSQDRFISIPDEIRDIYALWRPAPLYRAHHLEAALKTPYTMGHEYIPPSIHAGGLRYHGLSPIVSQLYADKLIDAVAYHQKEVFEAAVTFARSEGIVPAPESSHAIKCAIDKALECKRNGEKKTILFNLSGHRHFDMSAYDSYFSGNMKDSS